MRPFAVEVEEVESVVADLAATQRRLEQLAADLDRQMSALHADWAGHAATAHDAARRRWRASLDDLGAALASLAAAGERAAGCYRAGCEDNVAMWRQLG